METSETTGAASVHHEGGSSGNGAGFGKDRDPPPSFDGSLGRQVNALQDPTHQKHCWLDACEWKLESLPIHLAPVAPKQAHLSSGANAMALGVFKLPGQRGPAFLHQDSMKVVEE